MDDTEYPFGKELLRCAELQVSTRSQSQQACFIYSASAHNQLASRLRGEHIVVSSRQELGSGSSPESNSVGAR